MADWSMLPADLLGEIALKLNYFKDFVYFSAVCYSWHSAFSMIKKKWTPKSIMPWLMLPERRRKNPKSLRKLFDPSERRSYKLELPETFGARCWGTSSGWIVTLDLNLELYLFNPFTRARIQLPPQTTMPHQVKEYENDFHSLRNYSVDKVIVFDDNGCNDEIIVIALQGGIREGRVAYARPGDQAWTPVTAQERCAHDVVRWGPQLLILYDNGALAHCDMSMIQRSQSTKVVQCLPPPPADWEDGGMKVRRFYLLESCGELLLVLRIKKYVWHDRSICYHTIGFEVYKLKFDSKKWERVQDLGDVALFVGNSCSMSIRASAISNCKRNCIYFADDETFFWHLVLHYGGNDMGIYHLKDKQIVPPPVYNGCELRSQFCTALWFMPKFF